MFELGLGYVKPMQQRVEESLVSRKTPMMLATLLGAIALFLAAVGIYRVLAHQVAQRRKEIGIRMALGSDGRRIFGLIVSEGLWLLCLGIGVGLAGAVPARRAARIDPSRGQISIFSFSRGLLTELSLQNLAMTYPSATGPKTRKSRSDPGD